VYFRIFRYIYINYHNYYHKVQWYRCTLLWSVHDIVIVITDHCVVLYSIQTGNGRSEREPSYTVQ